MRVGQLSDKGAVRPNNEDSVYTSMKKDLFIIADGMGGHKAGEIASKTAISKIRYFIRSKADQYKTKLRLIADAIGNTNLHINNLAKKDETLQGMGTTVISVIIEDNTAYIGHVGDSRAYIINNKKIKQITTDHSLAQELLRTGSISEEEAQNYPHKNVITRALGCNESVDVDTYTIKLSKGDTLLLCTDGLTNMVNDREIFDIINNNDSPRKCAALLVDTAVKAGGTDNISVIVLKNN